MSKKLTLENFIQKAKEKHGDKYDYSLVNYIKSSLKIEIICPIHKSFMQSPNNHLKPANCPKCSFDEISKLNAKSQIKYIEECNKIHNFKYDYNKVDYINENSKIIIICKLHGDFTQQAGSHKQGHGCKKCADISTSNYQKNNSSGWSVSNWIKTSKKSKDFDNFKVYVIKCWNETEEFYKIGRTFLKTKKRFESKTQLPYKYEILKEIVGDAKEIVNFEAKLKKEHKTFKYTPKIKFNGMHECFYKINEINGINI